MMDQNDLKQLGDLIDIKLDTRIEELETSLESKIFAWKSDIIDAVDVLTKEIHDEREFRNISSHQTSSNTRRIEKLEKKVFGVAGSDV